MLFDTERIRVFAKDSEVMIQVHQLMWIGSNVTNLYLQALKFALDIDIKEGDSFGTLAKRVEESMNKQLFDEVTENFTNLVLPD